MKFLDKLMGKKPAAERTQRAEGITAESSTGKPKINTDESVDTPTINGIEIGAHISSLLKQADAEGWHPVASITVICNQCNRFISLDFENPATGEGIGFKKGEAFGSMENPLVCETCGSTDFRIVNRRATFKDWLKLSLDAIPECGDDPSVGFRDSETGELIRDHLFEKAETFEQLWSEISPHVAERGALKSNFTFNYMDIPGVGSTRINRTIGVAHQNSLTHELIVIIKDTRKNFWYRIERE